VLRPGGVLFLQLPAYQWLRSHHDEAVHTGHRYSATEVRQLVIDGGLRVRRVTYANSLLLPAAAAWRAINRFLPTTASAERSDVRPIAPPVNRLMRNVLGLEAPIVARRNLPFGLSVIAIAQRPSTVAPATPVEASDRVSVGSR
jgi:hypothetical protein